MSITQSHLNKQRKDKFELILTLPNILKKINSKNQRENDYLNLDSLQFSVYGVDIPSLEVPAEQLHYSGQTHNVTTFNRIPYPPVPVYFTIDNEFKNYWVVWKWLQLLNDEMNSTYGRPDVFDAIGGYPEIEPEHLHDYATTITVNALDEYNKPKVEFIFTRAFVTRMEKIAYNFRDPDETNCSFEFVFNQLDVNLV